MEQNTFTNGFKKKQLSEFSFRDCHSENKSKFKKAKDLEGAINVLKEMHYIYEIESEKKTGMPSRKILVNPKIFDKQEH